MKKLIIHLGLPKTATTTLQHHLFQKLHDDGKINFLGKVIDFDSHGSPTFRNNKGGGIRAFCEESGHENINVSDILHPDLINVYSEEGLMVGYPFQDNLPLETKIKNLQALFNGYDVKILLSLRNPVEYFHSLYVQFYAQYYRAKPDCNTYAKYISSYLNDTDNVLYESFDYLKIINLITSKFDTEIILYEDLKYDKASYYMSLSKVLGISDEDVGFYLSNNHENKKKLISDNKVTEFSFSLYLPKLRRILSSNRFLFSIAKCIFNARILNLKGIFYKKIAALETAHLPPSMNIQNQLEKQLLLPDNSNLEQYNLNKRKLCEYGYLYQDEK